MGVQNSLIQFKGKNNKNRGFKKVYNKKNITYIGAPGGPTQYDLNNLSSMVMVKANTQEFGGSILQSKVFNRGIIKLRTNENGTCFKRMTNIGVNIIKLGAGSAGERLYNCYQSRDLLLNFNYSDKSFYDLCRIPFTFSFSVARNILTATFPAIDITLLKYPKFATHFRIGITSLVKSNAAWDITSKKYLPVDAISENTLPTTGISPFMDFVGPYTVPLVLTTDNSAVIMTTNLTFVGIMFIAFFVNVNGNYNVIKTFWSSSILFVG